MTDITKYQKELLKVAQLSVADLPSTLVELNKMIWTAYKIGAKHGAATNDRTANCCMGCKNWRYTNNGMGECSILKAYTDEAFYCRDFSREDG